MLYRIGFILLALGAIALGLIVGTLNSEPVHIDLLWVQVQWPLGLVLLIALVAGVALGIAITWLGTVLPARLQMRKLRASVRDLPSGVNDA